MKVKLNPNQEIVDKIKELWAELALTDDAKEKIKGFKCIFFFGGLLGISGGILAIQPHVSCMIIICMLIACMMIMGGVSNVYTPKITVAALQMLQAAEIGVEYDSTIEFVENRTHTDR